MTDSMNGEFAIPNDDEQGSLKACFDILGLNGPYANPEADELDGIDEDEEVR